MIKYIIFKSSSSKYDEEFQYHLYLIVGLPVRDITEAPFTQPQKEAAAASI